MVLVQLSLSNYVEFKINSLSLDVDFFSPMYFSSSQEL